MALISCRPLPLVLLLVVVCLLQVLVSGYPIKQTQECTIPPYYRSVTLASLNDYSKFTIAVRGYGGENTCAAGKYTSVIVWPAPGIQYSDFIFWFEIVDGPEAGTRIGQWECCSSSEPLTEIYEGCEGANATIINASPVSHLSPLSSAHFKLLWKAPKYVSSETVKLVATIVTEDADEVKSAYTYEIEIIQVEVPVYKVPQVKDQATPPGPVPVPPPAEVFQAAVPIVARGVPTVNNNFFDGPIGPCTDTGGFPASPITLPLWVGFDGKERLLTVPPVAEPTFVPVSCDAAGRCFKFYDITMANNPVQIFPGPPTEFFSYGQNGVFTSPGPTIKTCVGEQVIVRHHNTLRNATGGFVRVSVHLHGAASFAPYDGWADDLSVSGQFKDYVYPANREQTIWYHDHAVSATASNVLSGLYGQFWVEDCCSPRLNGIMPDRKFDLPLVIGDMVFGPDNQPNFLPQGIHSDTYDGDHNFVNGQAWPVLHAEPRVYRFRVLNGALTRTFFYQFQTPAGVPIPFYVVATDGGFLQRPLNVTELLQTNGERFEIIVDLRDFGGQTIFMTNGPFADLTMFCQSHMIMKIVVDKAFDHSIRDVIWAPAEFLATDLLPGGKAPLEEIISVPMREAAAALPFGQFDRQVTFVQKQDGSWAIQVNPPFQVDQFLNATIATQLGWVNTFDLPQPHVVADPFTNRIEIWEIVNGGVGWFHPIHTHLIDALLVARTPSTIFPAEVNAAKDLYFLPPGDSVRIIARWGPHSGSFMFHCHNLVHEDNSMLLAFGTQMDHAVVRQVSDNIFQADNTLVIPVSPPNSINNFTNSLRNPMLASLRPEAEPPILDPAARVLAELENPVYKVFYPDLNDPSRPIDPATGYPFPLGQNPYNPYEVDYTCIAKPLPPRC